MTEKPNTGELLELTTEIVSAHAANNTVAPGDLPRLIQEVYKTLSALG
ncbi:MAG TPA: MucR family transcriptional regulator, partial [Rhodospirillales bacterium]|nr:MucR family transcriptional regulator [Rhodospirillales bacterium]